ncbi:TPA: hypothetical protein DCE37_07650 [Candidatus Latescibacteria bacterium]|nr:hypothetical protein [Candidatus Latescibacterota bacterium]
MGRRLSVLAPLAIVLGWALLVRVAHLYAFFANSPFSNTLVSDAYIFDAWAARIAAGDWAGEPRLFVLPPLYPYLLGSLYKLVGHYPSVAIVLQSLLGVVASGLVWRLARDRFGAEAGLVSGVLFGSVGTLLFYESMLVGTSVAVVLTVLLLVFIERWRRSDCYPDLVITGLILGLLAILRPNFLLVIPAVGMVLLWPLRADLKRLRSAAAVFVVGAAIPLLVLTVRNGAVAGEWMPMSSHGGINFYMGNHPGAPGWFAPPPGMPASITPREPEGNLLGPRRLAEAETGRTMSDREVSAFWFGKGLAFFVDDPVGALGVTLRKVRLFLSAHEVPLNYSFDHHRQYAAALNLPFGQMAVLFPLGMMGLIVVWRGRRIPKDWLLIGLVYGAGVIAFHVATRYRMPVVPILVLFAGAGVSTLISSIMARDWRTVGIGVAVSLFLIAGTVAEKASWEGTRSRSMDPFNLGTSHLYAGEPAEALPHLEAARRAGGQFVALHYNLGLAYTAAGRPEDALASYRQAIDIQPDLAPAHMNLGNIHFQANRFTEAASSYRSAIASDPEAHNARAALGWVHFTYHRNDSARVAWQKVLEREPGNRSALAGMDRLKSLR